MMKDFRKSREAYIAYLREIYLSQWAKSKNHIPLDDGKGGRVFLNFDELLETNGALFSRIDGLSRLESFFVNHCENGRFQPGRFRQLYISAQSEGNINLSGDLRKVDEALDRLKGKPLFLKLYAEKPKPPLSKYPEVKVYTSMRTTLTIKPEDLEKLGQKYPQTLKNILNLPQRDGCIDEYELLTARSLGDLPTAWAKVFLYKPDKFFQELDAYQRQKGVIFVDNGKARFISLTSLEGIKKSKPELASAIDNVTQKFASASDANFNDRRVHFNTLYNDAIQLIGGEAYDFAGALRENSIDYT